jgi:ribosome-binding factor A
LERVQELLREVVSEIMRELKDPRVGFATITTVTVSPDIHYAKIFVSIFGEQKVKDETIRGLNSARGFIRKEISKKIRLRYIPEISFHFDESIERGSRVLQIINEVTKSDDSGDQQHGDEIP